ARVRAEAWPEPTDAEEVHEALLWMGYATEEEARPWLAWLAGLRAERRVSLDDGRWFAAEAARDPKAVLRGRLDALAVMEDPEGDRATFEELEREGTAMRARLGGRTVWGAPRLLARIRRAMVETLRREIEPATAGEFLRFLAAWQHADERHRLEGPAGVAEVVRQLAGFEAPAAHWEGSLLPARVRGYRREWLDQLALSGDVAWGRLWGGGAAAVRVAPIALLPREELDAWTGLAGKAAPERLSGSARAVLEALAARGPLFPQELLRAAGLVRAQLDGALGELAAYGAVTCDSFQGLRGLIVPPSRRRGAAPSSGRWSLFRRDPPPPPDPEFAARRLLDRTGIVFRRTLLRERIPVPWRDLVRVYRLLELRGEVRGGRFVAGMAGEQYAHPDAVSLLRTLRRGEPGAPVEVSAADPLNFRGILTPDDRVAATATAKVRVG
ncbi:MAG: hypothetical protein L0216_16630, partial [Planctomycetales bacterium]|nr:hypothetical protein [Planctomycetales bacterium]